MELCLAIVVVVEAERVRVRVGVCFGEQEMRWWSVEEVQHLLVLNPDLICRVVRK